MQNRQKQWLVMVAVCTAVWICSCGGSGVRETDEKWARGKFESDMKNLHTSLDLFKGDCGCYPTTEEGFEALVTNPGIQGWRGPYREPMERPDPWNTPYRYVLDGEKPKIISAGKDKQFGTADDLSN